MCVCVYDTHTDTDSDTQTGRQTKKHRQRSYICDNRFFFFSLFSVTSVACRSRWASLQDHFRRKHKELTTTQSGQAANKKRKWYLYDFLTFLIPSCSSGATSGNLSQIVDADEDRSTSSDDEITRSNSPLSVQSIETTHSAPKQAYPRNQARCSRKKSSLSTGRCCRHY